MAEFIGDMDRLPFVRGQIYPIEVSQRMFGVIEVTVCRGPDWKPLDGYRHGYRDLHNFLHVWKINEQICKPEAEKNGFYKVEDPRDPQIIV